jgi:methylated-DNA-protein-cysteine methyltransferase-like protein
LRTLDAGRRVPWHRVINAQGRISLPPGSRTAQRQRELLLTEGVLFRNGRIDLRRYGWEQTLDELLWGFPAGSSPTAAP